ncbi:sensor histidine kinase [Methylophilus sp. VKM B-3414]|uniref:sensor histidine kinase n=1 Tax=Methylophilus sp. VKM B-3414 TaxID=3076121 RepID=UPI0028C52412|nr:sensor histidine kinase [Methylophilus sp. VKM B-3414]MDT7849489.1 sensor histidine kinase [Methylophilus sp. VKM B-3414]
MMPPLSLKSQLRLWLLLPMLVVLGVSAALSYSRALLYATQAYDQALLRTVLALADEVIIDSHNQVKIEIPEVASHLLSYNEGDHIYIKISDPKGKLVFGEAHLPLPKQLPAGNQQVYYNSHYKGEAIRAVTFGLPESEAANARNILISMAETTGKRDAMVAEMVEEMLLPQVLMMLLAAIVIELGIYFALKPLQDLRESLHQRSYRDLSALDTQATPNELQPLLQAMNALLARVKAGLQQQQQFIADASHQLRTPIAGLQTQAELALRSQPPEAIQEPLNYMLRSTTRLSHLIQRLLTMARTDAAVSQLQFQPVSLTKIISDECARWIGPASNKQLELDVMIETQQDQVLGDALMLSELLNNLLENAIQYTPKQGLLQIRLSQAGKFLVLEVADSGIGIPADQTTLVFERFHRLDPNQGNGCGLGLAIVAEIAEHHNASITVTPGLAHPVSGHIGSQFTVKFERYDERLPENPRPANPDPKGPATKMS